MAGLIRSVLRAFGKDLVPYPPRRRDRAQLVQVLDRHGVDVVLDVGANVGQYASGLRAYGYDGRIVSFEPVAAAHAGLERAARDDAAWTVAPRMALGAETGTLTMHVSNRTDMSSALPMRDETLEGLPQSYYVAEEDVPAARLDAIFDEYVGDGDTAFLKVDTQGFERNVLDGSRGVIGRIAGVQLEMSLRPLYEGEAIYLELIDLLAELGFQPTLILGGFFSKTLKRQLQVDGVFFRS